MVILIVLDSVGIGQMPDSKKYGDDKVDTLGNVYRANNGLNVPTLKKLGLFNIDGVSINDKYDSPAGSYGRLAEISNGKDTTTGHWEIAGIYTKNPFPTYPSGFPDDIIKELERRINRKVLGNYPASGTQIIDDLGEHHMQTGDIIVYTSADSVFQIAAHEDVISIAELYKICETARELLTGEHEVARVIARPFEGEVGNFTRTSNRHDYAITPPERNLLCYLTNTGVEVTGVGKIYDIFAGNGIKNTYPTKNNFAGMQKTIELAKQRTEGFIFTNLVDFDMKYGHRNNPIGYAKALEEFDIQLA
ncbi:MAG: phosphopentomutase, partial [Epulopiscium sp. Nuni2H_MBin003]